MTTTRRLLPTSAAAVIGALAFLLSGCTTSAILPTPAPAPTVTQTLTATPEPDARAADTPLEALDAWAICESFISDPQALFGASPNQYAPEYVTEVAGVFTVYTVGPAGDQTFNGAMCKIGGTLGNPEIIDWHTPQ